MYIHISQTRRTWDCEPCLFSGDISICWLLCLGLSIAKWRCFYRRRQTSWTCDQPQAVGVHEWATIFAKSMGCWKTLRTVHLSMPIFSCCWQGTWGFCSWRGGYLETHSLDRFVTTAFRQRGCKQNHKLFSLETNVAEVVFDLWAWRWWLSGTSCRISHNSESKKGVFQRQDSAQRKHEGVLLRSQILRDWFLDIFG